jgi:RNA polymerase sigma factor (TIGR02999 family)
MSEPTGQFGRSEVDVTRLLDEVTSGRRVAVDELLTAVYGELRGLAQRALRDERAGHTLQATALVHEVYLKLVDQTHARWQSRAHFFAVAAQAIRRILVDHARTVGRQKRGGGRARVALSDVTPLAPRRDLDLLALDEALQRLTDNEPTEARIVEMRYFAGLTIDEIAEVLDLNERTVRRRWNYARAWLYREITKGDAIDEGVTRDAR